MKKRITIEVEVSGHEQFDEEQVENFLAFEFNCGCSIDSEEYDECSEHIDYRVISYMVED